MKSLYYRARIGSTRLALRRGLVSTIRAQFAARVSLVGKRTSRTMLLQVVQATLPQRMQPTSQKHPDRHLERLAIAHGMSSRPVDTRRFPTAIDNRNASMQYGVLGESLIHPAATDLFMMIRRNIRLDRWGGVTLWIGLTGGVAAECSVSRGERTAGLKQIVLVRRLVILRMISDDNLNQAASGIEIVKEIDTAEVRVIEWMTWMNDEAREAQGTRAAVGTEVPAHLGDFLRGYGIHLAAGVLGEAKRMFRPQLRES